MADVFLSYRNTPKRRALVRRLALILRAYGLTVWWDYGLEAGKKYEGQIEEQLELAKVVVPIWCEQSIVSEWVQREARAGVGKLIPARLQNIAIPLEFESVQAADLTNWSGAIDDARLIEFVRHVCERLGRASVIPPDMIEELQGLRRLPRLPITPARRRPTLVWPFATIGIALSLTFFAQQFGLLPLGDAFIPQVVNTTGLQLEDVTVVLDRGAQGRRRGTRLAVTRAPTSGPWVGLLEPGDIVEFVDGYESSDVNQVRRILYTGRGQLITLTRSGAMISIEPNSQYPRRR